MCQPNTVPTCILELLAVQSSNAASLKRVLLAVQSSNAASLKRVLLAVQSSNAASLKRVYLLGLYSRKEIKYRYYNIIVACNNSRKSTL